MLAYGQVETLAHWIDALPADVLASSPQVLLRRANLHLMHGDYLRALPLLADADQNSLALSSPEELPALQVAIAVARSKALFQTGQYEQARCLCFQALNDIPNNEIALSVGKRLASCGCTPLLLVRATRSVRGSQPSTLMRPEIRVRRPTVISIVVVLPAPYGKGRYEINPDRVGQRTPVTPGGQSV